MTKRILTAAVALLFLVTTALFFKLMQARMRTQAGFEAQEAQWNRKVALQKRFTHPAKVVMLGDSLMDYAPWSEIFPGLDVANRGIAGDTSDGILKRLDYVEKQRPQKVFMLFGINDFKSNRPAAEVFSNYEKAIRSLVQNGAQVFVLSTLQCNRSATILQCDSAAPRIAELNNRLAGMTSAGVTFINLNARLADPLGLKSSMTYDGIHLNEEGYKVWADTIAPLVN